MPIRTQLFNSLKTISPWKIAVIMVYAAFVFVGLYHHEIWRDEAQALLIARDSPSLGAMLWQLHYEGGQPPVWYFILYVITRLGGGISAMQIVHGMIAVGMAAALLRFDLPKVISVLLLAGYFFFYEYAIISRPYSLSVLFLLLAAYELSKGRRDWKCGLWLGLASLTTIHAMILVVCLLPLIIRVREDTSGGAGLPGFLLIVVACLVNALICLVPAPDEYYHLLNPWIKSPWLAIERGRHILNNVFPLLPSFSWPQKWLSWGASSHGKGGWLLYIASAIIVFRFAGKKSGAIFLTGSIAILALVSLKYLGGSRHHGYIWVWMIFSLFIVPNSIRRTLQNGLGGCVFVILILMQIPLCLSMWGSDLIYPFSNAKAAAKWILAEKGNPLSGETIFGGYPALTMSPVVAYTGGRFFAVEGMRVETFVHNDSRFTTMVGEKCLYDPTLPDIWIYGKRWLPNCEYFQQEACYDGVMLSEESYCIYKRLNKQPQINIENPPTPPFNKGG